MSLAGTGKSADVAIETAATSWWRDPVLIACLAGATLLRCWGIGYGLPDVYNPDESSILLRALSLGAKTLNPHNFLYPSLYLYVLAAAVGGQFLVLRALGRVASLKAFETAFLLDPTRVYLLARWLSVAAGVLAVAGTYALALKVGSRRLARSAAALMAVAFIPVRDAHFVKHDVAVTFVVVLVVLASWHIWQRGRLRDSGVAGLLAGTAFAMHYYAAFAVVPVAAAHFLRSGIRAIRERRAWIAAAAFLLAFACLSPYVLIDHDVALRDMAANRQIVVGRGIATFGWFGAGIEHAKIIGLQGAGFAMSGLAIAGLLLLIARGRLAIWLLSFPVAFFIFLANAWPFGRLENPLYPFLAILAACAIDRFATRFRAQAAAAVLMTAACMVQPVLMSVTMDRFLSTEDTRAIAKQWIERHVPAGSGIAVIPGSVQLVPTAESLREALTANVGGVERASRRFQAMLALDPYPSPAYRLVYVGKNGRDQDKVFEDPEIVASDAALAPLARRGVRYVVVKGFLKRDTDPLRARLARAARLVFRVSPFNRFSVDFSEAQLPDYDVRPKLDVDRAGPIVEVWELK